jgi:hypothetical protein
VGGRPDKLKGEFADRQAARIIIKHKNVLMNSYTYRDILGRKPK